VRSGQTFKPSKSWQKGLKQPKKINKIFNSTTKFKSSSFIHKQLYQVCFFPALRALKLSCVWVFCSSFGGIATGLVPQGCSPALEPAARPGHSGICSSNVVLWIYLFAPTPVQAHIPQAFCTHKHHTIPLDSWSISTDITIHQHETKPTGLPAHSQGCTHNPAWLSVHSQAHWHNFTGLPMRSQGRTYKLIELPVRSLGCTITQNTNTSASGLLFITQNGYPYPPYTRIRLQKTCSPAPASVIIEAAQK